MLFTSDEIWFLILSQGDVVEALEPLPPPPEWSPYPELSPVLPPKQPKKAIGSKCPSSYHHPIHRQVSSSLSCFVLSPNFSLSTISLFLPVVHLAQINF